MTWVDWVIGGILCLFIILGYRKGFMQQFFDLLGGVLALILAFCFYQRIGGYLTDMLHMSATLANLISFILIVVLICGSVSFIGKRWNALNKDEPIRLADAGFGAILGGLKAAVILIIVLLIIAAMPWDFLHGPIAASSFANDLLRLAPLFYVVQDHSLPPDLPRLVVSPEGLVLRKFSAEKLKAATCIACGSIVEYRGLVKQGLSYYPQTHCPKCGRVSDGCLTFEGYHMLNGACPYEKLGSMGVIDCKVWPNQEPTQVHGTCPVCGRTQ